MYLFAFLCMLFAAGHVLAEPIPIVHDRLIRRCDNHTSLPFPPYGYAAGPTGSPTVTLAFPVPESAATSLSNNTTADALGTSTAGASGSSGAVLTAASSTTSLPAGISFPSSGLASSTQSIYNGTWGTASVTEYVPSGTASPSTSSCLGFGCTAFPSASLFSSAPLAASSSGVNGTETLSSISTETITLVPASSSGSVGLPGSTIASAANTVLQTITMASSNTSTVVIIESITSIVSASASSAGCTGYANGCLQSYFNSTTTFSSPESSTAGAVGTSNTNGAASATSPLTSTGPGTISINGTASVTSPSFSNGSLPTLSSSNVSYSISSYVFDSGSSSTVAATTVSAAAVASSAAITSLASTDLSPFSQVGASASASIPSLANATNAYSHTVWAVWTPPPKASAQSTSASPTTFATSFVSSNSTGTLPTGGWSGSNSTESLTEIEAEVEQLAGDSVGLIEEIDSLLAKLGPNKRRASKRGV